MKKGFFLASPPEAEGYFDILCPIESAQLAGDARLSEALQFLQVGDELAVKGGSKRLSIPGGGETIDVLSVLASGMGILPTLQLLRMVLADPQSSVRQVEVVWINDAKKDFLFNEQLSALEELHGETGGASGRLRVTRVVDREAGNPNTLLNGQLRSAVSAYMDGCVAMVMAEGVVAGKAKQLFAALGYPQDCVAALTSHA